MFNRGVKDRTQKDLSRENGRDAINRKNLLLSDPDEDARLEFKDDGKSYYLKHGSFYLSFPGLTLDKNIAKKFDCVTALKKQSQYSNDDIIISLEEVK